jgi:hypothetical protein
VPVDTPAPTPTQIVATPEREPEPEDPPPEYDGTGLIDLVLALGAATSVAVAGFYISRMTGIPMSAAVRTALVCLVGGMLLYVGYLLYAPGADWLRLRSGVWASGWVSLVGGLVPLVAIFSVPRFRGATNE